MGLDSQTLSLVFLNGHTLENYFILTDLKCTGFFVLHGTSIALAGGSILQFYILPCKNGEKPFSIAFPNVQNYILDTFSFTDAERQTFRIIQTHISRLMGRLERCSDVK